MDDIRSWWEVPSIAHFCSLFRSAFKLTDFDIEDLEDGILASCGVEENFFLTDLLCQLLQGCYGRKDISDANYELYLKDILQQRWEVEEGKTSPLADGCFKSLPARKKVEILHAICDYRLDALDVQDLLKGLDANNMRVDPLGQDVKGATYWYFYGTRLYKEDALPDPPQQEAESSRKKKNNAKSKKPAKKSKTVLKTRRQRSCTKRNQRTADESDSESEKEENSEKVEGNNTTVSWHLVCSSLEDWQRLAEQFEKSKVRCEKDLHQAIVVDFLPEIPVLLEEKEKELKRKLLECAPRRVSNRLETKRQTMKPETQAENGTDIYVTGDKEIDVHLRKIDKQEQERLEKEEKERIKAERTRRMYLREERARLIADGKEIPPELRYEPQQNGRKKEEQRCQPPDAKTLSGMLKVIKAVRSHKMAWPFCEPVQESFAPSYFDIIKHPMDISVMEKKVRGKEYNSRQDFISDFRLIARNCHKYNGPDNEYSEMVDVLEKWFNKSVKKYIPKQPADDDREYVGSSETSASHSSRPSRAASSRALEALHQAAAEALQASSRSASSSSDELSGDETSSNKPGFVIKMVPFPGSNTDANAHQQQHSSHGQVGNYISQLNQPPNQLGNMSAELNAVPQNYGHGSGDQQFSFTALLQGASSDHMYDMNAHPNDPNRVAGDGAVGHSQQIQQQQQQQYQMYNQAFAKDNQAMSRQQGFSQDSEAISRQQHNRAQAQMKRPNVDQSTLNQMSSAVNPGYQMMPGVQPPYHDMRSNGAMPTNNFHDSRNSPQGGAWGGNQSVHNSGTGNIARPDQSKAQVKPGSIMGHALPQLPAPRTSRVQVRPKAPVTGYCSPGVRQVTPRTGLDPGPRQAADPFSLLKKNIREMEQKDQAKMEGNLSHIGQNGPVHYPERHYENVSPANSLANSDMSGENSSHLPDTKPNVEMSGCHSTAEVKDTGNVNQHSGNVKDSSAPGDFLESDNSEEGEESEEEESFESSPKKDRKGNHPHGNPTIPADNGNGSASVDLPKPTDALLWKDGKLPGPPNPAPGNDNVSMFQSREHQMYGVPTNVTVMADGGFQMKPSRNLHPGSGPHVPQEHKFDPTQGHNPRDFPPAPSNTIPQLGNQSSASNSPVDYLGKAYDRKPIKEEKSDTSPTSRLAPVHESSSVTDSKPLDSTSKSQSNLYDVRSSIMEQAKLMRQNEAIANPAALHLPVHPAQQAMGPYDPGSMPHHFPQFYPGVELPKREVPSPGQQPLPQQLKPSTIPIQSQPLKKRKLYENVEQEVPATPPSKIWRPGLDMSAAALNMVPHHHEGLVEASAIPASDINSKLPQNFDQKSHQIAAGSDPGRAAPSAMVKQETTCSSNSGGRSARESPVPQAGRSSPQVMVAPVPTRHPLNLSHLKQESGKSNSASKPADMHAVNSQKHVSMAQPSLSTSTHPTFVTMPGMAPPHLVPPGHPGSPHQMAMMGMQPAAFPFYHPYMLQQRHAELEMQKHMHENSLLYHQQLMQSSQQGLAGYAQFPAHMAAAAQQKLMVPENSAQQRLLAHLAQTHRANGLLPHQYAATGRPPHP